MTLHLDPPEDVLHLAVAIDHEGGALDTPEAPAVEILLLVGSVLSRDRGVLGLDAWEGIAESTGFHGAAWRVVLGIEIEDDALAAEFGKGHAASQRAGK